MIRFFVCDFPFAQNEFLNGWVTEKMPNAWLARAVPIYAGAGDITDLVNEDSFVNCNNVSLAWAAVQRGHKRGEKPSRSDVREALRPHVQGCLAHVRRLNEDPAAYKAMITQSVLLKPGAGRGGFRGIFDTRMYRGIFDRAKAACEASGTAHRHSGRGVWGNSVWDQQQCVSICHVACYWFELQLLYVSYMMYGCRTSICVAMYWCVCFGLLARVVAQLS